MFPLGDYPHSINQARAANESLTSNLTPESRKPEKPTGSEYYYCNLPHIDWGRAISKGFAH